MIFEIWNPCVPFFFLPSDQYQQRGEQQEVSFLVCIFQMEEKWIDRGKDRFLYFWEKYPRNSLFRFLLRLKSRAQTCLHIHMRMQGEHETDLFDVICPPPSFTAIFSLDMISHFSVNHRSNLSPFLCLKNEARINCLPNNDRETLSHASIGTIRPTKHTFFAFLPLTLSLVNFAVFWFNSLLWFLLSPKPMRMLDAFEVQNRGREWWGNGKNGFALPFSCSI